MDEFSYELKIPKDRIAVLIGSKGEIKQAIEEATHTHLEIDSSEGDIFIKGSDGLGLYQAREVVQAIGRGFNPEIALLLLKPDYSFELITMTDYHKTKKGMIRLKGRVIGKDGRSRELIEELTETHITIYGKTIGIIGEAERVPIARHALESLLNGSPHSNVYHWLEKQRRKLRQGQV